MGAFINFNLKLTLDTFYAVMIVRPIRVYLAVKAAAVSALSLHSMQSSNFTDSKLEV